MMTRQEHLDWAKQRAQEYVDQNDLVNALASIASDLNKHEQLRGHMAIGMGMTLRMNGHLATQQQMREWIDGIQ